MLAELGFVPRAIENEYAARAYFGRVEVPSLTPVARRRRPVRRGLRPRRELSRRALGGEELVRDAGADRQARGRSAGEGALTTWRTVPRRSIRKSSTSVPSRSSTCARMPQGPKETSPASISGT